MGRRPHTAVQHFEQGKRPKDPARSPIFLLGALRAPPAGFPPRSSPRAPLPARESKSYALEKGAMSFHFISGMSIGRCDFSADAGKLGAPGGVWEGVRRQRHLLARRSCGADPVAPRRGTLVAQPDRPPSARATHQRIKKNNNKQMPNLKTL